MHKTLARVSVNVYRNYINKETERKMLNCLGEIATGVFMALPIAALVIAAPYLEQLL